jgi:hypothetical protein
MRTSVRHSAPVLRSPRRSRALGAVLVAGVIALSTWQAQLRRDDPGAHWTVALLVVVAIGAAVLMGRRSQRHTSRVWVAGSVQFLRTWCAQPRADVVSVVIWSTLIGGVVGWDLVSFICQSHALPTLSYFIGHVTRYQAGRGILFALWLGVGAYLVAAERAQTPQ